MHMLNCSVLIYSKFLYKYYTFKQKENSNYVYLLFYSLRKTFPARPAMTTTAISTTSQRRTTTTVRKRQTTTTANASVTSRRRRLKNFLRIFKSELESSKLNRCETFLLRPSQTLPKYSVSALTLVS
jgi:hypothetical protein